MTVYAVDDVIAVGVPEIAPVEADNDSPVGNAGEIDQEVTIPHYMLALQFASGNPWIVLVYLVCNLALMEQYH